MNKTYYDIDSLINVPENELKKDIIPIINILIKKRQFSENFLFEFIDVIEPYICLKYQKGLSPTFCFDNLYSRNKSDGYICFNDIIDYFKNKYSVEELRDFFIKRN